MAFPADLTRTKNWGTEVLTDSDLEGQFDLIIDWLMAAMNASTGHTHDGTSNQSPKLTSSAVGDTFVSGLTTVTGVSSDYFLIGDASDSTKPKKALASDFSYTPTTSNALSKSVVQVVNTITGAVATGTTTIPEDDTIPQNTEGDQYMTLAITPSNASNTLKIEVVFNYSSNTNAIRQYCALFQDSTANALAVAGSVNANSSEPGQICFTHYMTAGTTSSTTFKVRSGGSTSATTTFNGSAGARRMGGVMASSITITEFKA